MATTLKPLGQLPPGPRLPKLLQTGAVWGRSPGFLETCAEQYGDCFTIRNVYFGTSVFVSDPESVRAVFTAPLDPPVGSGSEALEALMGSSTILLLVGAPHRRMRRMLLPGFHGERIGRMRDAVAEIAHAEVDRWTPGRVMALRPRLQAVTIEVILRVVFGVEKGDERYRDFTEALNQFIGATFGMGPVVAMVVQRNPKLADVRWAPWARFRRAAEQLDALIYAEMRHRRRRADLADRADVLSTLLDAVDEDGSRLTDEEVRDQVLTLLLAGYETSATSLASLFDLVVHDEKVAVRLCQEAAVADSGYPGAVVKEALRLRPPLYFVARQVPEGTVVRGYELPAGVTVTVCVYLAHRHPDAYDAPLAFSPERFLDTEAPRYSWVPFGGGLRRCIGQPLALMEMEEVVKAVGARVTLEPTSPDLEPTRRRYIVFGPARGARVRIAAVA